MLDNRRGIVEDRLHGATGHEVDELGEKGAGGEGYNHESHKTNLLIKKFMKWNEARTSCFVQ